MSQRCLAQELLYEAWRLKLAEAKRRYVETRTGECRSEYRRVLALFTALVMRGVTPAEDRLS